VSAIKAIISTISAIVLTIWLLFGFGLAWTAHKFESDVRNAETTSIADSDDDSSDSRRRARSSYAEEYERERRREREGVNIDSRSAKPMVDVDPSHRY
jgi:hypothetical protein